MNVTRTPAPQFSAPTVSPSSPATAQSVAIGPDTWATMLTARRRAIMGQIAALRQELAEVDKLLGCAEAQTGVK